ncbi:MAG: hypothetical protein QOF48_2836 [Verrucomicrobiota bacterium]|jgi:glycosyltransferase involved in cell wall biosynthesis
MRILVLLTDAFGGHGGIAKFNRDLIAALCSYPRCEEVVAIPRMAPLPIGSLPPKLTQRSDCLNGRWRYATALGKTLLGRGGFDLVLCGHINLLPLAAAAGALVHAPHALILHGIEAWAPTPRRLSNRLAGRMGSFIAVSDVTKERFLKWTSLPAERGFILPNCVELSQFAPGPKSEALLDRYGLRGKTILMTFGRLDSRERAKGFDEVLECLPSLANEIPNIAYLIAGDGKDRGRLETKASELKVRERVVFAGRISEAEKAEHYRLADAYVMPSRGEGFGIVYLEALACGIPTVGSSTDGSREALRHGELGILVNPSNAREICEGIRKALAQPKGIPPGLDYFSHVNFEKRVHEWLDCRLEAVDPSVESPGNRELRP